MQFLLTFVDWNNVQSCILQIPYTSPTVHKIFLIPSLCNDITIISQVKLTLSYVYSFSTNMDVTSHKETWMSCDIHEFFVWTFFLWNNPIITYRWTLDCTQMPTHYDRSSLYPQSKCSKPWHFPILHWVPMLAYQAHVAQSCANTNIKPMQQESSFFLSQYDPSCYLFLPHWYNTKKESEKK